MGMKPRSIGVWGRQQAARRIARDPAPAKLPDRKPTPGPNFRVCRGCGMRRPAWRFTRRRWHCDICPPPTQTVVVYLDPDGYPEPASAHLARLRASRATQPAADFDPAADRLDEAMDLCWPPDPAGLLPSARSD